MDRIEYYETEGYSFCAHTCSCVAHLEASHSGVSGVPEVVTHGAPSLVVADLQPTLTGSGSTLQSKVTVEADHCRSNILQN